MTYKIAQADLHDSPNPLSSGFYLTALIIFIVASVLLAFDLSIAPERFYDYHAYLLYVDAIYHFPPPDWFVFEGLTKAYLLLLREIFGSTAAAVDAAHYLLLPIFLCGFTAIFKKASWEAAAIAAALFAPQLGLITIRATPAYILCSIAAMRAIDGKPWVLRLTLIATIFHVSAFLALIPIAAVKIQDRYKFKILEFSKIKILFAAIIMSGTYFLFAQSVFDILLTLFEQIPYLSKYSAYGVGLADPATSLDTGAEPVSSNHYIFFVGVTLLFLATVIFEREKSRLRLYAIASYVLYVSIFFAFSPVPAFRFVPFFAMPILAKLTFRGGMTSLRGMAVLPFLAVCLGAFVVQLSLVFD